MLTIHYKYCHVFFLWYYLDALNCTALFIIHSARIRGQCKRGIHNRALRSQHSLLPKWPNRVPCLKGTLPLSLSLHNFRHFNIKMTTFQLPTLLHLFLASIFFYVIYRVHWELTTGASRRALIKKHGCEPIKKSSDYNFFPNNVIGYKTLLENLAGIKHHNFLERLQKRYRNHGNNTMIQRLIFTDMIQTIEPDNLKTMLAVKFKDYCLGDRRTSAFIPFLGHGIFTTDGAAWQHSREMLRPNFAKSQVGDLTTFENHVSQLIKNLPRSGQTVDLQELFFQLTMDSATEFLFGESTNCLGSAASSPNMKFPECWNRAQEAVAERSRSGKLGQLLSNQAQFGKDTKFINEFADKFVRKGLELRKNMDVEKAGDEGRYIFLHELVKQTSDPVQIRSELLNILLAGRDTTASLLSDVWFILARRPDIWQKLRAEVDALDGEPPTYQQIKDMKYLKAVLNESKHESPSFTTTMLNSTLSTPSLPRRPQQRSHSRRRHHPPPRRRR